MINSIYKTWEFVYKTEQLCFSVYGLHIFFVIDIRGTISPISMQYMWNYNSCLQYMSYGLLEKIYYEYKMTQYLPEPFQAYHWVRYGRILYNVTGIALWNTYENMDSYITSMNIFHYHEWNWDLTRASMAFPWAAVATCIMPWWCLYRVENGRDTLNVIIFIQITSGRIYTSKGVNLWTELFCL